MIKCSMSMSIVTLFLVYVINYTLGYFGTEINKNDECFCELKGSVDDCSCTVDTVDYFNNKKIFPRLQSLLIKDYFRFYKVDLDRKCPFWVDDSRCAMSYCHVEACEQDDIPVGLKRMKQKYQDPLESQTFCDDFDTRLGYLNMSISPAAHKGFEEWAKYDDAQDNFCLLDEDEPSAQYVDLLLNPERYTGYKGFSANRIWRSIYMENCFRPKNCRSFSSFIPYDALSAQNGMCLEKRVFYRVLSGLHTSINVHLCANYLLSDKDRPGFVGPATGLWGPNIEEFIHRFHPDYTNGEGPHWLRNLYFIYLVELRALSKAAPYLLREEYFTGNESEDKDVKAAIQDLLKVVQSFPTPFNERTMFNGHTTKLKKEFQHHFQNISRIMDCVGCDKCKLWGKLQVQGLGTALKILFSGKFDSYDDGIDLITLGPSKFQLQRSEIVSLFNAFGRLSTSINELETFRTMKQKR